jgi:Arm DNA-binding domain
MPALATAECLADALVMPGGTMWLTNRTVAGLALAAGKGDRIHFDADLAGFGYRLRRGAGDRMLRSWVVQYRHAGIVRRYLIGPAEAIGAERARAAARKLLAQIALGEDPQVARDDRRGRDRLTFRTIAAEYVAARAAALRPKTLRDLHWYLGRPALPRAPRRAARPYSCHSPAPRPSFLGRAGEGLDWALAFVRGQSTDTLSPSALSECRRHLAVSVPSTTAYTEHMS